MLTTHIADCQNIKIIVCASHLDFSKNNTSIKVTNVQPVYFQSLRVRHPPLWPGAPSAPYCALHAQCNIDALSTKGTPASEHTPLFSSADNRFVLNEWNRDLIVFDGLVRIKCIVRVRDG